MPEYTIIRINPNAEQPVLNTTITIDGEEPEEALQAILGINATVIHHGKGKSKSLLVREGYYDAGHEYTFIQRGHQ
jgi:hypothetical protein